MRQARPLTPDPPDPKRSCHTARRKSHKKGEQLLCLALLQFVAPAVLSPSPPDKRTRSMAAGLSTLQSVLHCQWTGTSRLLHFKTPPPLLSGRLFSLLPLVFTRDTVRKEKKNERRRKELEIQREKRPKDKILEWSGGSTLGSGLDKRHKPSGEP